MRWSVGQFVTFTSRGKEMRGKIREVTLFRRSNTIGLLIHVAGRAPVWIGAEQVVRSAKGRPSDSRSENASSSLARTAKA